MKLQNDDKIKKLLINTGYAIVVIPLGITFVIIQLIGSIGGRIFNTILYGAILRKWMRKCEDCGSVQDKRSQFKGWIMGIFFILIVNVIIFAYVHHVQKGEDMIVMVVIVLVTLYMKRIEINFIYLFHLDIF